MVKITLKFNVLVRIIMQKSGGMSTLNKTQFSLYLQYAHYKIVFLLEKYLLTMIILALLETLFSKKNSEMFLNELQS